MKVAIKEFAVGMEVKSKGVEFEVRSPDGGRQIGDLVVTSTKLVWCRGKTTKANGIEVKWEDFIKWMES